MIIGSGMLHWHLLVQLHPRLIYCKLQRLIRKIKGPPLATLHGVPFDLTPRKANSAMGKSPDCNYAYGDQGCLPAVQERIHSDSAFEPLGDL